MSLLSFDKIEAFRARGAQVADGAFGENLVVAGIDFRALPLGARFGCNDVVLELTQIGKECHSGCAIYKAMGECIMPKEGVFTKVLHGGTISVDVPLWTADDITALTRIVPQTLTDWAWCGFVSPTDLPQGRRFLADEVTHVQQMAALIGAGVECGGANRMIR